MSYVANADGSILFRATRADGTVLWQRHRGARGAFFVAHDLMHLAVETVLGTCDGFFGLLAAGWDITDTEGKGARGALPPEAQLVEQLVGLFDREQLGGAPPLDAPSFVAELQAMVANAQLNWAPALGEDQLRAVRTLADALRRQWLACPVGEPLALHYTRPAVSGLRTGR